MSKGVGEKCGKRPDGDPDGRTDGLTDGRTDGHHHTIIRSVWRRAYKNGYLKLYLKWTIYARKSFKCKPCYNNSNSTHFQNIFITSLLWVAEDVTLILLSYKNAMIWISQIFDILANEYARYSYNESEFVFYILHFL